MKYFFTTLLCCIAIISFSQEIIDKADNYYNLKDYKSALKIYTDLYSKDSTDAYINGQIGLCYANTLYAEINAIQYIEKSFETKKFKKNEDLVFALATAYLHNHQFDKAITLYESYCDLVKTDELKKIGNNKIENCINAQALVKTPQDILFINQGKKINTEESDVNPFITHDEKLLIYSSNYTSDFDIYINIRKKIFNSWTISQEISKDINTDINQIVVGVDADGDNIYYTENLENYELENISFQDFMFQSVSKLSENVNTDYNETGVTFIGTDTLIFSSDKPGGFGGTDLYYSIKLPDGSWGYSLNMGDLINSEFDENFPVFVKQNSTLYFSSNRPSSMGGYDIFLSVYNKNDSCWNLPKNFGYPLNNTYDQNTISFLELNRYAYVSRYENDSYGKEDIYKAVFKEIEPQIIIFKIFIEVYDPSDKSIKNINECNTNLNISLANVETGEIFGKYSFDKNKSFFVLSVPPGIYNLNITGENYEDFEKTIFVEERYVEETLDDLKIELEIKE